MIKKSLISLALLFVPAFAAFPQQIEIPQSKKNIQEQIITHTGYVVSYNSNWLIPNWVAYELTSEEAQGEYPRRGGFCPDPDVIGPTAISKDYSNTGWDRGHMAPAGDMKWSEKAMYESHYLSNVCPQDRDLNGGLWMQLEQMIRTWAIEDGSIYIACGPIMSEHPETLGQYNKVSIPTAFFKVVCKMVDGVYFSIGFIFPNQKCSGKVFDYACSVDEIEKMTGHDFFYILPDRIERKMESVCDLKQVTNEVYKKFKLRDYITAHL